MLLRPILAGAPSSMIQPTSATRARNSLVEDATPFERLEQRRLMSTTVQLDFDGDAGGLTDQSGVGTGFTQTQTNAAAGATISGAAYDASLLQVDNGLLKIQSLSGNDGTNSGAVNSLVNALQLEHDASSAFVVQTRIVGENNAALTQFDARYEQAGILLGGDGDNWVKLVAIHHNDGPAIQFMDEWSSGLSTTSTAPGDGLIATTSWDGVTSLDLRIEGNPSDGTLSAQYRINDGIWLTVPHEITVPAAKQAAFFGTDAAAGLVAFHRNIDVGRGLTAAFESFSIAPKTNGVNANSPSVSAVRPGDGATDVRRDIFIAVDIDLPGGAGSVVGQPERRLPDRRHHRHRRACGGHRLGWRRCDNADAQDAPGRFAFVHVRHHERRAATSTATASFRFRHRSRRAFPLPRVCRRSHSRRRLKPRPSAPPGRA